MKKYFITGLVILLPAAVTCAIVWFLVDFFTKPFIGITTTLIDKTDFFAGSFFFLSHQEVIEYGSRIFILLLLFAFTLFLGMIAKWFFMNSLIALCDKVLLRIPFVKTVYKTSQDVIKTLFSSDKNSLKQVVMVPFPRSGVYALGLIARESPSKCCKALGEDLISVLIPTTPNPTTGFLLMFPKKELILLDMKAEEAIKYIVSCGVIIPENPHLSPKASL